MSEFFITPLDLRQRMAKGQPLRVFDVRRPSAIEPQSRFVPGARWRSHKDASAWASQLPSGTLIVVNCMHGHNVSQLAASTLRQAGSNAMVLEGGIVGWIDAGLPTVGQSPLAPIMAPPTTWVTRLGPKVDRVACSWLIRRFIDPDARFLFAEPDWVNDIAAELNAVAFDTPGAPIEHDGNLCSFDTLLREFSLNDPALAELAVIVRAADTNRNDLAAEAAGLLAIMLGNSARLEACHDVVQIGIPVYDAIYARCVLAAGGKPGWQAMRA